MLYFYTFFLEEVLAEFGIVQPMELPRAWLTSPIPLNLTKEGKLYAGRKRGRGKEGGIKVFLIFLRFSAK